MNKKTIIIAWLAFVAMVFASCGSDEPNWDGPEAHEKTERSCIPNVWYAKCRIIGIVGMGKSPYLCTIKSSLLIF